MDTWNIFIEPALVTLGATWGVWYLTRAPRRKEMDLSNDNVLRSPSNPKGRPRQIIERPPAPLPLFKRTIEVMAATGAVSKDIKPADRATTPYLRAWPLGEEF